MALSAVPKRSMTDVDWEHYDMWAPDAKQRMARGSGDLFVSARAEDGPPPRKRNGLVIECVLVHPPSSAGKTVYIHFDDEDVTKALLAFRDSAREARSRPEPADGNAP